MTQAFFTDHWRKCSSCKKNIAYQASHFVCSVSTCTRKRTGYVFCSVHCWERHLPGARHRDAAAIEAKAPTMTEWKKELAEDGVETDSTISPQSVSNPVSSSLATEIRQPNRVIVRGPSASPVHQGRPSQPVADSEVLVIASRLKAYIKTRSDMNTSDAVMETLSEKIRQLCNDAIDEARADGRKTVMERDFKS